MRVLLFTWATLWNSRPTNAQHWQHWLERLYRLRRDKRGTHERPHKPVLLLSIIDQLDRGVITDNKVPLDDNLVATFKRYFEAVRKFNDQPTIEMPFYYLSGDGFWELVPAHGRSPLYEEGSAQGPPPSIGQFRKRIAYGRFDDGLWSLLRDELPRHQLREALVARYFPDARDKLAALLVNQPEPVLALNDALPPGRDAAFRRTILEIYDYRCAACGVRVLLDYTTSLVEAAHIVPFSVSRNDQPNNGLALCPNHHWAMDRLLIAPCPDETKNSPAGVWRINEKRLDRRIEGQRDIIALHGASVIAPSEKKFYPAVESLRWRQKALTGTYAA